jgi:hypothetical protein
MENILLDQVLKQVQNREISIEKARELICVLFNVSKSKTETVVIVYNVECIVPFEARKCTIHIVVCSADY